MPSALKDLKLHGSGKVREIYVDGEDLVMVASDRISVYDVILPTLIPDKGRVLTQMSLFWFELTSDICPNHFISEDVPEEAAGRGMRVRKLDMYPVECVVRGLCPRGQRQCGCEQGAGESARRGHGGSRGGSGEF